jgi:hypothetical protein
MVTISEKRISQISQRALKAFTLLLTTRAVAASNVVEVQYSTLSTSIIVKLIW